MIKRHKGELCFLGLLSIFCILLAGIQINQRRQAQPNQQQRIAATLTAWGVSLNGVRLPVSEEQIEQRLADLRSPIGEVRVQAAWWLAAHGVRDSGNEIAAAMDDPGTYRPCQLAKSLGDLGDDRWTEQLITATEQQGNADLQVCATLALGQLQSPKAVDALIRAYEEDRGTTFALKALSNIADPTTLAFFQRVQDRAARRTERLIAERAIKRIHLVSQTDPGTALIKQLQRDAAQGQIDEWVLRRLARLQSPQAVPALRDAYRQTEDPDQRVWLAAALLAHHQPGHDALRAMHALTKPQSHASILGDALALIDHQDKSVGNVIQQMRIRTSGRGLSGL